MKQKPITKETAKTILETTDSSISEVVKVTDSIRKSLNHVSHLKNGVSKVNKVFQNNDLNNYENFLEYGLLIGLIYLDLTSATRAYLLSTHTYQKLSHIRQIIVIINEGFKQIYNFISINKKGDKITKNRNKSYWIKEIGSIVKTSLPGLNEEYERITQELESYFEENFESIKIQRDLSVHYDKKASKVYDMIINLKVEETFRKMSPFLKLLKEMFDFIEKMHLQFYDLQITRHKEIEKVFDFKLKNLEERIVSSENEEERKRLIKILKQGKKLKQEVEQSRPATNIGYGK
ncbi:hypothetical protein ACWBC2_00675 [Salegentibacter agarivorans]